MGQELPTELGNIRSPEAVRDVEVVAAPSSLRHHPFGDLPRLRQRTVIVCRGP
jgi:hypothetical protein